MFSVTKARGNITATVENLECGEHEECQEVGLGPSVYTDEDKQDTDVSNWGVPITSLASTHTA
ncbi:hypothetical protein J6590_025525, partial [Homalodisca vitripennis]